MLQEILESLKAIVTTRNRIVTCPIEPVEIPGITAANALEIGDCMGTPFKIQVPKSGIIISSLMLDLDDEGVEINLELFKDDITVIGDDNAWAPTDADLLHFVAEIAFASFDDHINNQTSEVKRIDKAYSIKDGVFTIQAVTRGEPNIAAGSMPKVQLHILSTDYTFVEV